uniref:Uncharacterized protein n=1 Tax=Arundo donax TaxID=35708 RepID=A0A0A9BGV6_ARUDO
MQKTPLTWNVYRIKLLHQFKNKRNP